MIRDATIQDIPEMVRMGWAFYQELGYDEVLPFDAISFTNSLKGFIKDQIALVCEGGMAVAVIAPSFVNTGQLTAHELFFWVDPEKRGAGMALLKALEDKARERGAKTMAVVACDSMRADALSKAYIRRGYKPVESTFVRAI